MIAEADRPLTYTTVSNFGIASADDNTDSTLDIFTSTNIENGSAAVLVLTSLGGPQRVTLSLWFRPDSPSDVLSVYADSSVTPVASFTTELSAFTTVTVDCASAVRVQYDKGWSSGGSNVVVKLTTSAATAIVAPSYTGPTTVSATVTSLSILSQVLFTATATDALGLPLTFSVASGDSDVKFVATSGGAVFYDANMSAALVPAESSSHSVPLVVTNGFVVTEQTVQLDIDLEVLSPVVATVSPRNVSLNYLDRSLSGLTLATLTEASDPGRWPLTYAVTGQLASLMHFEGATLKLSAGATLAESTTYTVPFTVSNGLSQPAESELSLVVGPYVYNAPTVAAGQSGTATLPYASRASTTLVLGTVAASDASGTDAALAFTVTSTHSGVSFAISPEGHITVASGQLSDGATYTLNFIVSNGLSAAPASGAFVLTAAFTYSAPSITAAQSFTKTIYWSQRGSSVIDLATVATSDPQGLPVTVSVASSTSSPASSAVFRVVSGNVLRLQSGLLGPASPPQTTPFVYTLSLTASNGHVSTTSAVTAALAVSFTPDAPVIVGSTAVIVTVDAAHRSDTTLTLATLSATETQGLPVSFSVSNNAALATSAGVQFSAVGGAVKLASGTMVDRDYNLVVAASSGGAAASMNITISVRVPPVVASPQVFYPVVRTLDLDTAGIAVGTLAAPVAAIGPVVYAVTAVAGGAWPFSLAAATGVITTRGAVDRVRDATMYSALVSATDTTTGRAATTPVTLNIGVSVDPAVEVVDLDGAARTDIPLRARNIGESHLVRVALVPYDAASSLTIHNDTHLEECSVLTNGTLHIAPSSAVTLTKTDISSADLYQSKVVLGDQCAVHSTDAVPRNRILGFRDIMAEGTKAGVTGKIDMVHTSVMQRFVSNTRRTYSNVAIRTK